MPIPPHTKILTLIQPMLLEIMSYSFIYFIAHRTQNHLIAQKSPCIPYFKPLVSPKSILYSKTFLPFFMGEIQLSKGYRATTRRQFTFYHYLSRRICYSFDQPQKHERLSWLWTHPVVLNLGLLDWESSALTTRPLFLTPHWNLHMLHFSMATPKSIYPFSVPAHLLSFSQYYHYVIAP